MDSRELVYKSGIFILDNIEYKCSDIEELVSNINKGEYKVYLINPMDVVNDTNDTRVLGVLLRNNIDIKKLGIRGNRIEFTGNTDNGDIANWGLNSKSYDEYREFILHILIGWAKLIRSDTMDKSIRDLKRRSVVHIWDNGMIATHNYDMLGNTGIESCILNNNKYYTIRISGLEDRNRYYSGYTYGMMLAKRYNEDDLLKELGEEKYVLMGKSTRNIGTEYIDDTKNRIHSDKGEFTKAMIRGLVGIADNKECYILSIGSGYEIAFKNSVPVKDAIYKVINELDNSIGINVAYSISVINSENRYSCVDWDTRNKQVCSIRTLRSNMGCLRGNILERVSRKSANCTKDIISLFNFVKSYDNEWNRVCEQIRNKNIGKCV